MLNLNEGMVSYLGAQLADLPVSKDGIYKLSIPIRYWNYKPSADVESFKSVLVNEYGHRLIEPNSDQKPTTVNIGDLLALYQVRISFDFLDSLRHTSIEEVKREKTSKQYRGLAKYGVYIAYYWGSFVLGFVALIYSINRFYRKLYTVSKIDVRSLLIQLVLLGVSVFSIGLLARNPWVGMLFLPVVGMILIAEIWAAMRVRYRKESRKTETVSDSDKSSVNA